MNQAVAILKLSVLLTRPVTTHLELCALTVDTRFNAAENSWEITWDGPEIVRDWAIFTFENTGVGEA